MRKYDLEERLIEYAVLIINVVKLLPKSIEGSILGNQLIKSGTSPALNYGEAQSAESRKDFIHKSSVILKELRESHVCLRIVNKSYLIPDIKILENVISETNELISIFVTSVNTAKKNMIKQKL
ncbi:MAG: four helix bundle protein [Bacteroidota bacterium]|nr:four helix bundle protein [Bacteroidota bacterium]